MAKRGETRDVIIQAAAKVFFENGFEKTSVKMILEEAHVVTGSFYHFFASKEALFEAVAESFMEAYTRRVSAILDDDTLDMDQIIDCFLNELGQTADTYTRMFQGNKLHWTVRSALHDRTLEAMIPPLARAFTRLKESGAIGNTLDVDDMTLARILIKGSEAIIWSKTQPDPVYLKSEKVRNALTEYWKRIISF